MSLEPSNRILESCEVTSQPSCLVSPAVSPALFVQTGRHLAGAVQWQRGLALGEVLILETSRDSGSSPLYSPLLPNHSPSELTL